MSYDPFAVDLWSLGVTCAEFFTPLELCNRWDEDEGYNKDGDDSAQDVKQPFILPGSPDRTSSDLSWSRHPLFDPTRGSIGLAWSIFRIRGTPTDEIWPVSTSLTHVRSPHLAAQSFTALPDAQKITFQSTPAIDLTLLLPNLPRESQMAESNGSHFPPTAVIPSPLDLLQRLLVYPPDQRLKAADALSHPWFRSGALSLPEGYSLDTVPNSSLLTVERYGIPQLLARHFTG